MAKLTAERITQVVADKTPGRHGDGNGLYLMISPGGSVSWIQRVHLNGKRLEKGLGGYPKVNLSAARKAAVSNKAAVSAGRNPWARAEVTKAVKADPASARAKPPTFREAAGKVFEANKERWKNDKTALNFTQTLERHVFPAFGDRRVDEVTQAEVLDVLTPIWSAMPGHSQMIRGRIRSVFRWAMAYGYRADNPAGEAIAGALPPLAKVRQHHRALPYAEIPGVMAGLDHPPDTRYMSPGATNPPPSLRCSSYRPALLGLQFLILTAARSNEIRGATWDEIDWGSMVWSIPARRMKMSRPHRVPLSRQAADVLTQARDELGTEGYRGFDGVLAHNGGALFPVHNGRMLGMNIMGYRLRKEGVLCVPHGFRSSFRDWAAEQTNYTREAIELSLAHVPGGMVEMAYFRSDLLEGRRELMQDWADFVAPRVGG